MLASTVSQFAARCALSAESVGWAVGACALALGYSAAAVPAHTAPDPQPPVAEEPSTVPAQPQTPPAAPVPPPAPKPAPKRFSRSWMLVALAALLLVLAGIVYYALSQASQRHVVPITPVAGPGTAAERIEGDPIGGAPGNSAIPDSPPAIPPVTAQPERPAEPLPHSPGAGAAQAPASGAPPSAPPAAVPQPAPFKPRDPSAPPAQLESPRAAAPLELPPAPEAPPKSRLLPPAGTRDPTPADSPSSAPKGQMGAATEPARLPEQAARPTTSAPEGVLIWSGILDGATDKVDRVLEIRGSTASFGDLRGALPGRPVSISVEPKDIGIAEAPGPRNGWSKVVLRSLNRRHTVVFITWHLIE